MKLDCADVLAFRGASIADLTYELENNRGSICRYSSLIVHVGTNDIFKLSVNAFKSAFCNLISLSKSLFPNLTIALSAILPRPVDFDSSCDKVVAVNRALRDLCFKMDVEFIHSYRYFVKGGWPLTELFAYKDGGLHLNFEGSRLLGLYYKRRVAHFA